MNKVSGEPEKPSSSRMSSVPRSPSVETGVDRVSDVADTQTSRQTRSRVRLSADTAVVGEHSSDVEDNLPVSSRLRRRSRSKSASDGKDRPPTGSLEVSAKSSPHLSHTKPAVSSSGLERRPQNECSRPETSNSAVASPLTPGNICPPAVVTRSPVTVGHTADVQNTASPKGSPVSLPGSPRRLGSSQPQRASFRLVVKLQSPMKSPSSSSSSSQDVDLDLSSDTPKRCMSTGRLCSRRSQQSPSTSSQSQRHDSPSTPPASDRKLRRETSPVSDHKLRPRTPPGSDRKLRPETPPGSDCKLRPKTSSPGSDRKLRSTPQRDTSVTRRSQRLTVNNTDVQSSPTHPVSASTPR